MQTNESEGYIMLHRKIIQWEWWDDLNTFRLFLTMLLMANHEDGKWRGNLIHRGELITSLDHLRKKSGLSLKSTRTSLDRLKSTSEVACYPTSKFTLIKINNYDKYQSTGMQFGKRAASVGQALGKQVATNNNEKNNKNENNEKNIYIHLAQIQNTTSASSTMMEVGDLFFEKFWEVYPRKVSKKKTLQSWNKIHPNGDMANAIISHVVSSKASSQWMKDGGQFIPHPTTYLNQERWKDEIIKEEVKEQKKKAYIDGDRAYQNERGDWMIIPRDGGRHLHYVGNLNLIEYR